MATYYTILHPQGEDFQGLLYCDMCDKETYHRIDMTRVLMSETDCKIQFDAKCTECPSCNLVIERQTGLEFWNGLVKYNTEAPS